MSKSTKSESVTIAPKSETFSQMFARAGGRFLGITTVNSRGKTAKFNGKVKSQSEQYVSVNDFISKKVCKIAKNSILSVSGI